MKAVYRADAVTHFQIGSDVVPDDYQLQANETFENPTGKRTPAKLTPAGWVDATEEEYAAYMARRQQEMQSWITKVTASPNQPADDKGTEALGALGKQVGQLVIDNQKNAQALQALGAQVASFISKHDANRGK